MCVREVRGVSVRKRGEGVSVRGSCITHCVMIGRGVKGEGGKGG